MGSVGYFQSQIIPLQKNIYKYKRLIVCEEILCIYKQYKQDNSIKKIKLYVLRRIGEGYTSRYLLTIPEW